MNIFTKLGNYNKINPSDSHIVGLLYKEVLAISHYFFPPRASYRTMKMYFLIVAIFLDDLKSTLTFSTASHPSTAWFRVSEIVNTSDLCSKTITGDTSSRITALS